MLNRQTSQHSVIALPGFLGKPEDWTTIIPGALVPRVPSLPLWETAQWLNSWALSVPPPRTLAGYSLGGRLALHAMILSPKVWDQCLIVSAHTGLKTEVSKRLRREEDLRWAKRFECESWEPLMKEWNLRGALRTSPIVERIESDYSRTELSKILDIWSLGRQDDLQVSVEALNLPILWFVGERDLSFLELAAKLKFRHPKSKVVVAPSSGHRLLFDNPGALLLRCCINNH